MNIASDAESLLSDLDLEVAAPNPWTVARRLGLVIHDAPLRWCEAVRIGRHVLIDKRMHDKAFVVAHEVAHVFREGKPPVDDEEAYCNAFAGALLVPTRALTSEWQDDVPSVLSRWPMASQTCVALRLGEAGLINVAVIHGATVRHVRAYSEPPSEIVMVGAAAIKHGLASSDVATGWRIQHKRAVVVWR